MATILVIDDDEATRLLVGTVLGHAGHRVIEAADGRAGLELARAQRPDLVLLDLSLPVVSGTELLRELRADSRTRDLRVALYTAGDATPALADFMEIYGVVARVPKPCEPATLIAAVAGIVAPASNEKKS